MKHGIGKLTPIQLRRANTWRRRGFTAHQAKMFSEFPTTRPYMVRFYQDLQHTPNFRALDDAELWALWRRAYDLSVSLGNYEPPPEKHYGGNKPHRKLNPDGSINRDYTRNYERARRASTREAKPNPTDAQKIEQLEQSIRNTDDPARQKQFRFQIENIRKRMARNG